MKARDEKRLRALQKQLTNVKLLIVDELAYVPFTAIGAELFFEIFSRRYEHGATLVTSNLPFDEWISVPFHQNVVCVVTGWPLLF